MAGLARRLGRLERDTLLLLAAQAYYRFSSILLLIAVSRRLSPSDIGVFSFASSFAEAFLVIASLNLNPVLMRRVASEPDRLERSVGALVGFRIASAPVYLAVVCGAALLSSRAPVAVVVPVAVATLLESLYFSFGSLFLADKKVGFNVGIGLAVHTTFLVAAVWGLWTFPSLGFWIGANLVRSLLLVGVAAVTAHLWLCPLRPRWDWSFIREGAPFVLITFIGLLRERADTLALGLLADYATVGTYYLALRVVTAPLFLPGVVAAVFFPHLVSGSLSAENRRRLLRMAGAFALIGLLGAGVCWLWADPLSRVFYGPLAGSVAPLLRWMAFLLPLTFVDTFLFTCFQALYQEKRLVRLALATGVIGIGANLLLIPIYGVRGAILAQILSTALRVALLCGVLAALLRSIPHPDKERGEDTSPHP